MLTKFNWTPETERALLLAAIKEADLKPSKAVWEAVAATLGGGVTAGAVSQKYSKIKNAAATDGTFAPTTLTKKAAGSKVNGSGKKRKAASSETTSESDNEKKPNGVKSEDDEVETPSKKVKTENQEDAGVTTGTVGHEDGVESTNGVDEDEA